LRGVEVKEDKEGIVGSREEELLVMGSVRNGRYPGRSQCILFLTNKELRPI
jgi:hypothetical protein